MAGKDEDDVPPLEDMSELLEQVDALKQFKAKSPWTTPAAKSESSDTSSVPSNGNMTQKPERKMENTVKNNSQRKSGDSGFAGMKKGFLFGSGSAKSKTSKSSPVIMKSSDSDIPYLKSAPQNEQPAGLQIPEVQEALQAGQAFADNKEWVTDSLLEKISKNPTLAKRLGDASFMQAISEFQNNPQAAMSKYAQNAEMQNFLKEFCGILGSHFTNLADLQGDQSSGSRSSDSEEKTTTVTSNQVHTQPPVTSNQVHTRPPGGADISVHQPDTQAEDQRVRELLSDPEITNILLDERIQEFIRLLRTKPDEAQRALQVADKGLRTKIQRLVNEGVLQFQR